MAWSAAELPPARAAGTSSPPTRRVAVVVPRERDPGPLAAAAAEAIAGLPGPVDVRALVTVTQPRLSTLVWVDSTNLCVVDGTVVEMDGSRTPADDAAATLDRLVADLQALAPDARVTGGVSRRGVHATLRRAVRGEASPHVVLVAAGARTGAGAALRWLRSARSARRRGVELVLVG